MPVVRSNLPELGYFLAIARCGNFRRAAVSLGLSGSALSHAMQGLESRLGVRLLNRTNRSVTLTAAGEELRTAIKEPFATIADAVERLNRLRDTPSGRIRLNVPTDASDLLLAPVLHVFAERYPDIEVEIATSNRLIDVVDGGFDGGIRYGGTVPEDMIAQRLSADIRWVVAASPKYLERYGTPRHPHDLCDHRCLRFRLGDDRIYRWEFERDGDEIAVDVGGTLLLDDSRGMMPLLLAGAGLLYAPEPRVAPLVADGSVKLVLEEWASSGPGFFAYYTSRRQTPLGLRLLIDLIREIKPLGM